MPTEPPSHPHTPNPGDIWPLLNAWPFLKNGDEPRARLITAANGRRMIQARVDIGILQMEPQGRPDGTSPHGMDSLLAFYTAEEHRTPDDTLPYKLDADACAELQVEVNQYYNRCLAYAELENWLGVVDDSGHILDVIDLVGEYADADESAWQFTQLYPAILVQHTHARVALCRKTRAFTDAKGVIENAIRDLSEFFAEQFDSPPSPDATPPREISALHAMLDELEHERPRSQEESLQEQMNQALRAENYEKAAFLRDQLKRLGSRAKNKKRLHPEG